MNLFWSLIYNLIIAPLGVGFYIIFSVFSKKMRKGVGGRMKTFSQLRKLREKYPDKELILFHSASLGEYEQVKPVVKGVKAEKDVVTVVSFTSPSGYENADRIPEVDLYIYLPFDVIFTTRKFLKLLNPEKIIFVTYELWPNILAAAKSFGIKTYLISARIRSTSRKWKFYTKSYFASLYRSVDNIFTVTTGDKEALEKILNTKEKNIQTLGDPRYDQVIQRAEKRGNKNIPKFFEDGFIICIGSAWEQDLEVISQPLIDFVKSRDNVRLIVAPHETDDGHVNPIINQFEFVGIKTTRYSQINGKCETPVLVVDGIGVLAELYHQSDMAFVGGSFKKAIHNVMEPAIAGIPVLFGPFYHNSREAQQLVQMEGGFSIKSSEEFDDIVKNLMDDEQRYQKVSAASKNVILRNKGAGQRIVKQIFKN